VRVTYVLVLAVGVAAGTISGIIGTGASIMLVPVLVLAFGPKHGLLLCSGLTLLWAASR
jgi:hypothetical protein